MIAQFHHAIPEIFERHPTTGFLFHCTESFVCKFLHKTLKWSERATTRAAQKIPLDAPEQIHRSFIRQAKAIRDYDIPDELRVNADQQQTHFQMGSDRTWAPCGDKQVASVRKEEKRAFTLMVAISACGEILAYQAIWDG
ncbi:hypothetical protein M422DRAFT_102568, partial [Sphaerobolus stellatus SS14]